MQSAQILRKLDVENPVPNFHVDSVKARISKTKEIKACWVRQTHWNIITDRQTTLSVF